MEAALLQPLGSCGMWEGVGREVRTGSPHTHLYAQEGFYFLGLCVIISGVSES